MDVEELKIETERLKKSIKNLLSEFNERTKCMAVVNTEIITTTTHCGAVFGSDVNIQLKVI